MGFLTDHPERDPTSLPRASGNLSKAERVMLAKASIKAASDFARERDFASVMVALDDALYYLEWVTT